MLLRIQFVPLNAIHALKATQKEETFEQQIRVLDHQLKEVFKNRYTYQMYLIAHA